MTIEQELGYLALAVVQAGAYIPRSECSLGHYLKMYKERCSELFASTEDQGLRMDDLHDVGDQLRAAGSPRLQILEDMRLPPPRWHFRSHFSESCQRSYDFHTHNQRGFKLSQHGQGIPELVSDDGLWDMQKFLKMILEIRSYPLIDFDKSTLFYSSTGACMDSDHGLQCCTDSYMHTIHT